MTESIDRDLKRLIVELIETSPSPLPIESVRLRRPRRPFSGPALMGVVGVVVLLAGLGGAWIGRTLDVAGETSGEPGGEPLATFSVGNQEYELGTYPNLQGPDAPCLGISVQNAQGSRTTMACPTEEPETAEYAATIEVTGSAFVVGYGLRQGEGIASDDARRVIETDEIDGRRFFLIQLEDAPALPEFEIDVVGSDGSNRTIKALGLAA